MNDDRRQPKDTTSIEEANRLAERQSVFWRHDHPAESELSRDRKPPPLTPTSLLEGSRESLRAGEQMLVAANRKLESVGEVVAMVCRTCKPELTPFIHNAVTGVLKADVRRARAEVEHWAEYVRHFERQGNAPAPAFNAATFTPPWEGEKIDTSGEDNF
jgi:hypothetical protein